MVHLGVNPCSVDAGADYAQIFTGNTADIMVTVNGAGYGAIFDDAGYLIPSCYATDPLRAGYRAGE